MSAAVAAPPLPAARPFIVIGRTFLAPAFDYLLIGGGLSLLLAAGLRLGGGRAVEALATLLPIPALVLFANSAHFASSTVRLYAKPGAFRDHRFLTMSLPFATLVVLGAAAALPIGLGRHLQILALTWSPYHYAAQSYGLTVMYCYRSGVAVGDTTRSLLRAACLAPFLHSFVGSSGAGLEWFVPASVFGAHPSLQATRAGLVFVLGLASFLLPLLVFLGLPARTGSALPLISLLVMLSNAVWWTTFVYMHAFVWSTVFHGLQYLIIVTVFHVRDRVALADNRWSPSAHAGTFYLASLALGWALFNVWPRAYVAAGFGGAESVLLVAAAINVHHFIVDAYIWRLRRTPNYRIVTGEAVAPA